MTMTRRGMVVGLLLAFVVLSGTDTAFSGTSSIDPGILTGRVAVDTFLREHAGDAYTEATLGDFRVLDLDLNGRRDLIATIDSSGRHFFNHLLVLYDDGERFTTQELDVWNMESLDGTIQDLDGDGRPEILLRQSLTPYMGARPMAGWTAVFRLDGHQLVDQSATFPQFYEADILPRVEAELASIKAKESDFYQMDALTIERDKILRTLGHSESGLASALSWAYSEDPVRRIFASAVLSEIGGSEAAKALRELGEDKNPEVSAIARVAIAAGKSQGLP